MASEPAPPQPDLSAFDSIHDDLVAKYEHTVKEKDIMHLYATNIVLSRLALFTHHIRLANMEQPDKKFAKEYQDNFQADLSRYSSAVAEYKSISESLDIDSAVHLEAIRESGDSRLSKVACLIIANEQYEQQVAKTTNGGGELAKLGEGQTTIHESIRNMQSSVLSDSEALAKETAIKKRIALSSTKEDKMALKLGMVFLSSWTLLIPVLIMTLNPTLKVVLPTMTACVLIVGVLLVLAMRGAEIKDLVGATVAYTAVLVVFVGAKSSSRDDSNTESKVVKQIALGLFVFTAFLIVLILLWVAVGLFRPGIFPVGMTLQQFFKNMWPTTSFRRKAKASRPSGEQIPLAQQDIIEGEAQAHDHVEEV